MPTRRSVCNDLQKPGFLKVKRLNLTTVTLAAAVHLGQQGQQGVSTTRGCHAGDVVAFNIIALHAQHTRACKVSLNDLAGRGNQKIRYRRKHIHLYHAAC